MYNYLRAVVDAVFAEEAPVAERVSAGAAHEAAHVEVLVGDAKHLARALLGACLAECFTCKTKLQ